LKKNTIKKLPQNRQIKQKQISFSEIELRR
jgi:hypothetical protein